MVTLPGGNPPVTLNITEWPHDAAGVLAAVLIFVIAVVLAIVGLLIRHAWKRQDTVDGSVNRVGTGVDRIDVKIVELGTTMNSLGKKVDRLDAKVDRIDAKVEVERDRGQKMEYAIGYRYRSWWRK